jgi:hypothetical protein
LLKPFSANCSIGVSFRGVENGGEHVAALCVHCDFQPLSVDLTKKQVPSLSVVFNAFCQRITVEMNFFADSIDFERRQFVGQVIEGVKKT